MASSAELHQNSVGGLEVSSNTARGTDGYPSCQPNAPKVSRTRDVAFISANVYVTQRRLIARLPRYGSVACQRALQDGVAPRSSVDLHGGFHSCRGRPSRTCGTARVGGGHDDCSYSRQKLHQRPNLQGGRARIANAQTGRQKKARIKRFLAHAGDTLQRDNHDTARAARALTERALATDCPMWFAARDSRTDYMTSRRHSAWLAGLSHSCTWV